MHLRKLLCVAVVAVLLPTAAFAQSSITGVVSDNTGGILPGVTVEVASPVLIEGSRLAVTDGTGRYTIIDLRPGAYTVTMTLPGFSTFVQEGIQVPANFTQTVNGQLSVGGIEETVTVSGASPVVDVQSAARTEVMTRETIDSLPTPRNTQSIGYLAQGVRLSRPDVGGAAMMEQTQMVSHGANSAHTVMQVDGMVVNSQMGDGRIMNYNNQALSQEMAVSTSGNPAEVSAGGVRLNMIPKDGGNNLSGSMYLGFSDGSWQADNLDQDLIDQGLTSTDGISNIHDLNPSVGGPILRDKLWYFASARAISVDETRANVELPGGEQAVMEQYVRSALLRLTTQVSQRNKVSAYLDRQLKYKGREFTFGVEPTQASSHRDPDHANYHTFQAKWTSTLSSRSLLEVGYSQVYERLLIGYQPNRPISEGGAGRQLDQQLPSDLLLCVQTPCYQPLSYDQTRPWFAVTTKYDENTRERTDAYSGGNLWITPSDRFYPTASFSYVTGSHNFKTGLQWSFGNDGVAIDRNGHVDQRYRDGVPDEVLVFNDPTVYNTFTERDLGIYVQDTWTIDRLTINAGVRLESFASVNDTYRAGAGLPSGRFVTAREFPATNAEPFWNDIAPRFSIVYDLFGDARTALKFSVNKFMQPWTSGYGRRYHPIRSVGDRRAWFDCALNPAIHTVGSTSSVADCATAAQLETAGLSSAYLGTNGDNIAQDHEIGLLNDSAIFTGGIPSAGRRPDEDLQREYNIEWSGSVQHEILPRVSMTVAYYRRQFYDVEGLNNVLVADCNPLMATAGVPCGDWLPFTVASPLAGSTFLAFDRNPETRGLTDLVDRTSGINSNIYNGFEVSLQGRLPNGGTVFGGWTAHQHIQNTCDLEDPNGQSTTELIDLNRLSIQGGRFCDQSALGMPFRHDFKVFGAYPLPGAFELSGSWQLYSGNQREGQWTIPVELYPDGARTISSTVQLIQPGTEYFEYWNQMDVAVRKIFRIGGFEYSAQADVYNLFNNNAILSDLDTYGSSFRIPTTILQGRLLRLAFQMKW